MYHCLIPSLIKKQWHFVCWTFLDRLVTVQCFVLPKECELGSRNQRGVCCIQQHWVADSRGGEKYFRKLFWISIGLESLHIMENGPRIKWWEKAQVCVNLPLRPLSLVQTYFLQKGKRWIFKIITGHPWSGRGRWIYPSRNVEWVFHMSIPLRLRRKDISLGKGHQGLWSRGFSKYVESEAQGYPPNDNSHGDVLCSILIALRSTMQGIELVVASWTVQSREMYIL